MHILIKFFSQKSYLREFVSGKLYMNSLDYFWNNGFYEQKDIFEGVVCTVPVRGFNEMPLDFQAVQASDYHFRADGYRFCNVLCFYKVELTQSGRVFSYNLNPSMSRFGDYVAFIGINYVCYLVQHITIKTRTLQQNFFQISMLLFRRKTFILNGCQYSNESCLAF